MERFLDLAMFILSAYVSFELRFDGALPSQYGRRAATAVCIWITAKSISFLISGVRWSHWRYTSISDILRIVVANTLGSTLGAAATILLLGSGAIPFSIYIVDWLLCSLLTLGLRFTVGLLVNVWKPCPAKCERTRTLIYGAGAAGQALVRELLQNDSLLFDVIGLIDDDPQKAKLFLQGKRVLGTGETLGTLVVKHRIKKVLIAIPSATGPQMVRILRFASEAKVEYKTVPSLGELLHGTALRKQIRSVAVEDLLGRKPVELDLNKIRERIQGKVVMVTGAAGSIGSEICRQVAEFKPLALVGFDEAETPLFYIDREITRSFPGVAFRPEIGSISNPGSLRRVMARYHPAILYHAAAYKHVPLMEKHVFAAVETNIFGTWNVARAASECGTSDFVMISTDKAVRPTSMMGATKRIAELLIQSLHESSGTRFVTVRFGNVLGSNGSVVPIFKEQIAAGGPVTVTHSEMTRYFMTIPEAAQLVLQAFAMGKGGEVFVLEMGEPVRIADLARNLIRLSGLQLEKDIAIQYTGLRPGEKMFEELKLQNEMFVQTSHPKIRSYISNQNSNVQTIRTALGHLRQITEQENVASLLLWLKEIIPDYSPGVELLKAAMSSQPNQFERIATKHVAAPLYTESPVWTIARGTESPSDSEKVHRTIQH
jgi:FlaA1/EpsC-like NDP-sugar epimerase